MTSNNESNNPYLDVINNDHKKEPFVKRSKTKIFAFCAICLLFLIALFVLFPKITSKLSETNTKNDIMVQNNTESLKIDSGAVNQDLSTKPLSERNVYYAGLEDCTITKDSVVYLENLKENDDIFMAYEIYTSDNELIFKTDLIPSGTFVKWYPGETFSEKATYVFYIKHIPYYESSPGEYEKLAYQPVNVINLTLQ